MQPIEESCSFCFGDSKLFCVGSRLSRPFWHTVHETTGLRARQFNPRKDWCRLTDFVTGWQAAPLQRSNIGGPQLVEDLRACARKHRAYEKPKEPDSLGKRVEHRIQQVRLRRHLREFPRGFLFH